MNQYEGYRKNSADPFSNREFEHYFNELYSPLCRYCMQLVHDNFLAEDIVQEQFIYLWNHWNRLHNIDSVKAYLYRSVKNKSINYLKGRYTAISVDDLNLDDETIQGISSEYPQMKIDGEELEEILTRAIYRLPERCRIIFSLKRFEELTNSEIAHQLNISEKTVEAQMTIALKKLKDFISRHWDFFFILLAFSSKKFF